jgi:hypothetical protein
MVSDRMNAIEHLRTMGTKSGKIQLGSFKIWNMDTRKYNKILNQAGPPLIT